MPFVIKKYTFSPLVTPLCGQVMGVPSRRDTSFKSKTTCFTFVKMLSTTERNVIYDSKTTCFTVREGGDRFERNITQPNKLILNRL